MKQRFLLILRHYYLIPFIGFFILFSLETLAIKAPNSISKNFLLIFSGALAISLLVGSIYYLLDTRWGPRKREGMFSKPLFKKLTENGFIREEDYLFSKIKGFTVFVSYIWPHGKPSINIEILFNPKFAGGFYSLKNINDLNKKISKIKSLKKNNVIIHRNCLTYRFSYNFTPPSYEKLKASIEESIFFLETEQLKPISKEEVLLVLPQLREFINYEQGNTK